MGLRRIGSTATAIVAAAILLGTGTAASPAHLQRAPTLHVGDDYTFFLDGRSFAPHTVSVTGRPGRLAPGDVISVDNISLTLGPPGEYRFRSAPEGVLLELPGGGTRWVGVRVEPTYGEGPRFIDGMAPLSEADVRGLWGLRAETWTRSCSTKAAWLDASRVYLSLGQSASEGADDLPDLPRGLRYLEAMRFVGWKQLSKLRDLVFLDVLPEHDFDLRLIASLPRLRVLRLFSGRLEHTEALASLTALETLDLRNHQEISNLEFTGLMPRLRDLQLAGSSVRDLTPLAGLTHLESVGANGTPVERLPDGLLPALRSVDIIATPLTDEAVAAFRAAHPGVRVRHRWNESLRRTLGGSTRVRIGPGPDCGGRGASAPYETGDVAEISELIGLFKVDEQRSGGICGCLGGAEFEFLHADGRVETVQLVCNSMLRWQGWPGDGELVNKPELIDWLAARGVTGPRDQVHADQALAQALQRKTERATAGMSPRLRDAFDRDVSAAERAPGMHRFRLFARVLASEFPTPAERIRVLMRIYGAETGSWSGLDGQDQLADQLLRTYSRRNLQGVCAAALLGDDRQLRRGAARFWDSWQSPIAHWPLAARPGLQSAILTTLQESRSPTLRQRALSLILEWWGELPAAERERRLQAGLHDPVESVRRRAMLVAGQAGAASMEELLLGVLSGASVEIADLPSVPLAEQDTIETDGEAVGGNAGASEIAALALGYLHSRRAVPFIDDRAAESSMFRVARSLIGERCDLIVPEDFRTADHNQVLQLAAVESVVRCRGQHALDLALGYRQTTHWWEPDHVARALRAMLLAGRPPGSAELKAAGTLSRLRGWYQRYGGEYVSRIGKH